MNGLGHLDMCMMRAAVLARAKSEAEQCLVRVGGMMRH